MVKEFPDTSDLPSEWLEVGIDLRQWNWLARQAFVSNRSRFRQAAMHFGFMVQAVDDDELPEGLICDMHVRGVDLDTDPFCISN